MNEEGSPPYVVPDSITPVEGWKAWNLSPEGLLCSPRFFHIWPPGKESQASCIAPWRRVEQDHASPLEECHCGIYLAKNPRTAFGYGPILGRVSGWGKVVDHKLGWRVQYAYPTEIIIDNRLGHSMLRSLSWLNKYRVPVHVLDPEEMDILYRPLDEDILYRWERFKKRHPGFGVVRFEESES